MAEKQQVYAVVRTDVHNDSNGILFTVIEVLPTLEAAEAEVKRLNELKQGKQAVYFWQTTRFYPQGRDITSGKTSPHPLPVTGDYCCPDLRAYVESEDRIVLYFPTKQEFLIPVHDGGSSGIVMRFCPWCGSRLPYSFRPPDD